MSRCLAQVRSWSCSCNGGRHWRRWICLVAQVSSCSCSCNGWQQWRSWFWLAQRDWVLAGGSIMAFPFAATTFRCSKLFTHWRNPSLPSSTGNCSNIWRVQLERWNRLWHYPGANVRNWLNHTAICFAPKLPCVIKWTQVIRFILSFPHNYQNVIARKLI